MRLYIVRHGRAGDRDAWTGDDRDRPLTDDGRARTVAAARGLAAQGIHPALILTSPYTRAYETAQMTAATLAAELRRPAITSESMGVEADGDGGAPATATSEDGQRLESETRLEVAPALASGASLTQVATLLAGYAGTDEVLLVGHEPDLSAIIGALIGGGAVEMKKGACACVDLPDKAVRKAAQSPDRLAGAGTLLWLMSASQLALAAPSPVAQPLAASARTLPRRRAHRTSAQT